MIPKYQLFADVGEETDALSVKRTSVGTAFPKLRHRMIFVFEGSAFGSGVRSMSACATCLAVGGAAILGAGRAAACRKHRGAPFA